MITAVAIVVCDAGGRPIPGAICHLITNDGQFLFAITNGDGYALWPSVSVPMTYVLKLAGAAGIYGPNGNGIPVSLPAASNVTVRVGPSPANPQDPPQLPAASPSFKIAPISKDQLRAMPLKGNFGGMVLPGWGLSTSDALFDPMIPWYPEVTQQAIFEAKRQRGLNCINLCSWSDYHGTQYGMPVRYDWINNPQLARDYCIKLRKLGFIPIFHVLGDRFARDQYDADGGHCDDALNLIATMVPVLRDVVGALVHGYELRGCCGADGAPYSAAQYSRMLDLTNSLAPNVYKFCHCTAENSAGSSHSPGEAGDPWHEDEIFFWLDTIKRGVLDGMFYQAPTDNKLFGGNEWEDRWQEMIARLGRDNHVWPPQCSAVDLCWGEAGWYNIVRGDNTEAQLVQVSTRALSLGGKWSFSG